MKNVLIACEESQRVCLEFRKLGFNAFSCDIQDCSGGFPQYHIKYDCLKIINGYCSFYTCDGKLHDLPGKWDLIIAHPPCTYFSKAGAVQYFRNGQFNYDRYAKMLESRDFFMQLLNANCDRICIENPSFLNLAQLPPPTQRIQPWEFGEFYSKCTYLWLKGLPYLMPTCICDTFVSYVSTCRTPKKRSKTFLGIANAMAVQWSLVI